MLLIIIIFLLLLTLRHEHLLKELKKVLVPETIGAKVQQLVWHLLRLLEWWLKSLLGLLTRRSLWLDWEKRLEWRKLTKVVMILTWNCWHNHYLISKLVFFLTIWIKLKTIIISFNYKIKTLSFGTISQYVNQIGITISIILQPIL